MSNNLTTRLLAEIERREARLSSNWTCDQQQAAYLEALHKIVERHSERGGDCAECGDMTVLWPCATVAAVAEALEVTL